jgi:hypothetical protein
MLSLAFQRRSIQTQASATRPSRLMSMRLCRHAWGGSYAYTIVVETCLRHVLPRVSPGDARPKPLGCRGPFHDTNTNKNPSPAESVAVRGGKLQSKGLGFGAHCMMPLGFMHLHAPKPTARGVAIEACVPIPQSSLVTFFQRK